jgi:hypothetical protein
MNVGAGQATIDGGLGGRVKTGHLSTGKTGHLLTGDRDQ